MLSTRKWARSWLPSSACGAYRGCQHAVALLSEEVFYETGLGVGEAISPVGVFHSLGGPVAGDQRRQVRVRIRHGPSPA